MLTPCPTANVPPPPLPLALLATGVGPSIDQALRLLADLPVEVVSAELPAPGTPPVRPGGGPDHHGDRSSLPGPDGGAGPGSCESPAPDVLVEEARRRTRAVHRALRRPCAVEVAALMVDRGALLLPRDHRELLGDPDRYRAPAPLAGRPATLRTVVAHTDDGSTIRVFTGAAPGTHLRSRTGDGDGWAPWWRPEGCGRSLAQLGASRLAVDGRHHAYLALAASLRDRTYGGRFEAHVTVAPTPTDQFGEICAGLGVKPVVIRLPRGAAPLQPMTSSFHRGTLPEVQLDVFALAGQLVRSGLSVTRIKIEALGAQPGVPADDADAARLPANYFEFHAKVTLGHDADLEALAALCAGHDAHLSRNAHSASGRGRQDRFVTLRVAGRGRPSALTRFQDLLDALDDAGHAVTSKTREYTVYDSAAGLDRGWIDRSP